MSEWKEVRLGDLCYKVCSGGTPKSTCSSYYEGGTIPWLNTKEINYNRIFETESHITEDGLNHSSAKWIDSNAVVVAMYGATAGRVAIAKVPMTTNQACCNLMIDSSKADYNFIYYYLSNSYKYLLSMANGAAQQNLNAQIIKDLFISLPSLDEQRSIASILSSLDSKIENNRKICANLEAQAQVLFKHWFIDFAPFKDGKFVESELGMIPEGWRVGKLGDVTEFLNGFAFKSSSFVSKGKYKVITIKAVQDGKLITDSADEIEDLSLNIPSHCVLKIGDILLSLTGNVGRVCIVTQDNLVLNQRVCILNPRNLIDRGYVYTLSRTKLLKTRMINIAKGTAQANLSPVETSKLSIVVPPRYILDKFGIIANEYMSEIISAYQENQRLSSLRDTLLPKLMSGAIKV